MSTLVSSSLSWLGLNQLILISTDKAQDCFLITDRFLLVSWLSMPFCTSLFYVFNTCPFVNPALLYITEFLNVFVLFSLYVWINWVVTSIWWKFHVNSTLINIFSEKIGNAFNIYFTRCIHICLWRVRKLSDFNKKYLHLCSEDERMSWFWTTGGWVINNRILIFGWTIPLSSVFTRWKNFKEHWVSIHKDKCIDRKAKLFLLSLTFYWKYSVFTCCDFYLLSSLLQTCKSCACGVWVGEDILCKRGVWKGAIKTCITFFLFRDAELKNGGR